MRNKNLFVLVVFFAFVSSSASAQVPDITALGIPGCGRPAPGQPQYVCSPNEVEADGNPATTEYAVVNEQRRIVVINPRKFIAPGLVCWEEPQRPFEAAGINAWMSFVSLQNFKSRTTIVEVGFDVGTGNVPFHSILLRFDQCR